MKEMRLDGFGVVVDGEGGWEKALLLNGMEGGGRGDGCDQGRENEVGGWCSSVVVLEPPLLALPPLSAAE